VKVMVVSSYPPRPCGIGAYARDQADRLRAEGHDVTVLSPPDGMGDEHERFVGGGAFRRAAREGRRFDRILVHFQPALYYRPGAPLSKVATSLALLWLALRRRQLEIVVHEADAPVRWRPDYLLLGLAFRAATRLSFHTEAEWRTLERDYGLRVRGRVVPHRVEPRVATSRAEARRQLGIDGGGPLFVCPGFLHPAKGFDRAVRAFASVDGRATLYIVGSVREPSEENEAFARHLRVLCEVVPRVTLVERFVDDEEFDRWVAAADWVVLPYRRSWSSGVLARAQALGTPAIVAAVGGLAEQAGADDVVVADDDGLGRALSRAAAGGHHPGPSEPGSRGPGEPGPAPEPRRRPHSSDWDPYYEPPVPPEARRKGRKMLLGLILVSVLLAALAQLTLKHAMNQVSEHGMSPLSLSRPGTTVARIASQPLVWVGLATFGLSAAIWLVVLSRASLSFAYPFAALTYVMILLFDRFVLHDQVPLLRWSGVALIVGGILLISQTPHN
jgi:glycosyltransferase involved in cell wall biosynthesis/multidrug transporter EmrE-like cation transporter